MREIHLPEDYAERPEMLRVDWELSFPTVFLMGTLAAQLSTSRSKTVSQLLSDAFSRWSEEGSPTPDLVRREGVRSRESLLLPSNLVSALEDAAAARGWEVGLLVEYLSADYLAAWSGALARDAIAPWSTESPRVWNSEHARLPRLRPSAAVV